MPRPKGSPKPPGSGRQPGTPNKRNRAIRALEGLGLDPFEGLALLALGDMERLQAAGYKGIKTIPADTRVKALAELAQYIEPKLKAVDLTLSDDDGTIPRGYLVLPRSLTAEEWERQRALKGEDR